MWLFSVSGFQLFEKKLVKWPQLEPEVAFSGELSEPGSKLGEVPWIFGEYNVVEDAEVIERGDPKPIPESTDWGLLPMLLDTGLAPVTPGVVIGMVFPFPVPAMEPEPEIRRWGSKQKNRIEL